MTLVSVLIPARNAERYLAAALDSLFDQTFTDFEVVVVDDGSEDATASILADYATRHTCLRIIRQDRGGIVAALNRGLAVCRGPLVARMDADDVCLPLRLERQVRFLQDHQKVAAVGSAFQLISTTDRRGPIIPRPVAASALRRGLQRGTMLAHPTVMMRRDMVLTVGGYREALRHAEDYDLWTRLSDRHDLANLAECLLLYRIHGSQASWAHAEQQAMAVLAVRSLASQRRRLGGERSVLPAVLDEDFLLQLGVSAREVEDTRVAYMAGRITDYELVAMHAEAAAARRDLLIAASRAGRRSLCRSVTARLAWCDIGSARRAGRLLPALAALATCAWATATDRHLLRTALERVTASD